VIVGREAKMGNECGRPGELRGGERANSGRNEGDQGSDTKCTAGADGRRADDEMSCMESKYV
jgi:hypothetical protein